MKRCVGLIPVAVGRRRLNAAGLAVLVAALTLAAATGARAASCPPVKVFGVRGSGETDRRQRGGGYGPTVQSVIDAMREIEPALSAQTPVDYLAIPVNWSHPSYYTSGYRKSVASGVKALTKGVGDFLSGSCRKRTRVELVGYSQGAQVVADTYQHHLSDNERIHIEHIALLGDPEFYGGQRGPVDVGTYNRLLNGIAAGLHPRNWPASDYRMVRSYCLAGDPICNDLSLPQAVACGIQPSCPHFHYPDSGLAGGATYTLDAARFLLSDDMHACGREPYYPPPSYNGYALILDQLRVAAIGCLAGMQVAGNSVLASFNLAPAVPGWACGPSANVTLCRNRYQRVSFQFGGDAG